MPKPKINATTQNFIEIEDIVGEVVYLKGRNACSILEVSSVNFFLLSQDEQNARIYGYMSLLNSLSFAIQIVIISKKVDMGDYIKMLEDKIQKVTNPRIKDHLTMYREFIVELVKGGELLDKKLYVVIPFNALELGPVGGTAGSSSKKSKNTTRTEEFRQKVAISLDNKRSTVISSIQRIGLMAKPLQQEELAKIMYEIFNQETINLDYNSGDMSNVML